MREISIWTWEDKFHIPKQQWYYYSVYLINILIRKFMTIFQRFLTIFRRFPKIAEEDPKIFQLNIHKLWHFQHLNMANSSVNVMSMISSHVKDIISFSVKILFFSVNEILVIYSSLSLYLSIILRNRAEYRLILSRWGRRLL